MKFLPSIIFIAIIASTATSSGLPSKSERLVSPCSCSLLPGFELGDVVNKLMEFTQNAGQFIKTFIEASMHASRSMQRTDVPLDYKKISYDQVVVSKETTGRFANTSENVVEAVALLYNNCTEIQKDMRNYYRQVDEKHRTIDLVIDKIGTGTDAESLRKIIFEVGGVWGQGNVGILLVSLQVILEILTACRVPSTVWDSLFGLLFKLGLDKLIGGTLVKGYVAGLISLADVSRLPIVESLLGPLHMGKLTPGQENFLVK